jgi:hypothetical protein
MSTETYYSLLKFVPPEARRRMVIAGGYAANPELAGDIDLWILADHKGEKFDAQAVVKHLREEVDVVNVRRRAGYPNSNLVAAVPGVSRRWLEYHLSERAVTVDKKEIHVLVSDFRTPQELVDSFDISTHAIALDRSRFTFAKFYTSPRVTPHVARFDTPGSTLARLEKICARYGLRPRRDQLTRLQLDAMCESVVEDLAAA